MIATQVIELIRDRGFNSINSELLDKIKSKPIGQKHKNNAYDVNREFRYEIIENLAYDFSLQDLEFIRYLTTEEIKATRHDLRHKGLANLCCYLYFLGQVKDVTLVYDAKYKTGCMDASIMIEDEMLKMNQSKEILLEYINNIPMDKNFEENEYTKLIDIIKSIYDKPMYSSKEDYDDYLMQYYGIGRKPMVKDIVMQEGISHNDSMEQNKKKSFLSRLIDLLK